MSDRTVKLVIAYEGTAYHGWQRQPGLPTVQGTIETALSHIIGRWAEVNGASRTDAGVHAEGQVAAFRTDFPIPDEAFARVLTGRLPDDIVVKSSEGVPDEFDPSCDAVRKTYIYRVYTGRQREVVLFRRRWHYAFDLDIDAMREAGGGVLGTHDFRAFASAQETREDTVRNLLALDVRRVDPEEVLFQITADRFLYRMARNVVGTLVEIGRGCWPPDRMAQALASRDRAQAGPTAPAHGLCLQHIEYEKTRA